MVAQFYQLPKRTREKVYIEPNTGCWLWTGYLNREGYARSSGRFEYTHRAIYEWICEPIPVGKELDHLCKTRCCVNPAHLEPVTPEENLRRSNARLTWFVSPTHCKNGHPFDEANTYFYDGGRKRACRICKAIYHKRWQKRLIQKERVN